MSLTLDYDLLFAFKTTNSGCNMMVLPPACWLSSADCSLSSLFSIHALLTCSTHGMNNWGWHQGIPAAGLRRVVCEFRAGLGPLVNVSPLSLSFSSSSNIKIEPQCAQTMCYVSMHIAWHICIIWKESLCVRTQFLTENGEKQLCSFESDRNLSLRGVLCLWFKMMTMETAYKTI